MFQGYGSFLKFETKSSVGLDLSGSKEPIKITNINNIIKSSSGDFRTRHTCVKTYKFIDESEPICVYNDCLQSIIYNRSDGTTELLMYQSYFSEVEPYFGYGEDEYVELSNKLRYLNDSISVEKVLDQFDKELYQVTKFIIDLNVGDEGKQVIINSLFERYFFNDVQIGIMQSSVNRTPYITKFKKEDNIYSFEANVRYEDLDIDPDYQQFNIYPHRAGIFKINKTFKPDEDNGFTKLRLNLDPNVFVSSINSLDEVIIVNGIDENVIYDGEDMEVLKTFGDLALLTDKVFLTNANTVSFVYKKDLDDYLSTLIKSELKIILIDIFMIEMPNEIISFNSEEDESNTSYKIARIKLKNNVEDWQQLRLLSFLFESNMPKFSFITSSRDRLWALYGGRSYRNSHRPGGNQMKVLYSYSRLNNRKWSNPFTNQIDVLDCSSKSPVPDCLESIVPYRGYLMFVGRERTQVWRGDDPISASDLSLSLNPRLVNLQELFRWESTLNVGILNQKMVLLLDNEVLFINKDGLSTVDTNNVASQLDIQRLLTTAIQPMYMSDFQSIFYESQYRNMFAFNYEYNKMLGFRLNGNVYIIDKNQGTFYTKFSGIFSECKNITYDFLSKTLFLTSGQGLVHTYNDKLTNNSKDYWLIKSQEDKYTRYDEQDLDWMLYINWIDIGSTWYNDAIMINSKSNVNTKTRIYLKADNNYNVTYVNKYLTDEEPKQYLEIDTRNISNNYDEMSIFDLFSNVTKPFNYVLCKFSADIFSISLEGRDKYFVFDKICFCGTTINA